MMNDDEIAKMFYDQKVAAEKMVSDQTAKSVISAGGDRKDAEYLTRKRKTRPDSFLVLPVDPAAAFTFTWHPRFTEDGADVYFRQDGKRPLLVASDTFYEDIVPTSLSVIDFVCRLEEVPFPVPTCGLGYLFYREVRSLDRGKPPECRADTERYHLFTTPCCDGPQETWLYPRGDSAVLEIGTRTRLRKRYRLLYRTMLPKSVLEQWKGTLQSFDFQSKPDSCGRSDTDGHLVYVDSPYDRYTRG